jgi:hypothetical protein
MSVPKKQDLRALLGMIDEAHPFPGNHHTAVGQIRACPLTAQCGLKLADHLMEKNPAAKLWAQSGKVTAKRGPECFARSRPLRKTRACGRVEEEENKVEQKVGLDCS